MEKKWPLWGLKAKMYTATWFCDKAHRAIIVLYVMSECFKCGQTEGGLDDRSKAVSDVSVLLITEETESATEKNLK